PAPFAALWTCCGWRGRWSASGITPRTCASTSSIWCTARTSDISRWTKWSSTCERAAAAAKATRTDRQAFVLNRRLGYGLGFLACVGLMAYALSAQYGLGLAPCPSLISRCVSWIATRLMCWLYGPHTHATHGGLL